MLVVGVLVPKQKQNGLTYWYSCTTLHRGHFRMTSHLKFKGIYNFHSSVTEYFLHHTNNIMLTMMFGRITFELLKVIPIFKI